MKRRLFKNKRDLLEQYISENDTVLDIGFWGQGHKVTSARWPHRIIQELTNNVYGIDLDYDESRLEHPDHYKKASAENFDFDAKFDLIFAGDIIEHVSNIGLMLDSCARNLKPGGRLLITTPNAFSLFNLAGKLTNQEDPLVNSDHTCYFNHKTIKVMLAKNNWDIETAAYLYSLEGEGKESWKKKFLNVVYRILTWWTTKYVETMVIVATKK
jgi:2-polyprenyl-3-methyl-5-hydroxy-6-metoxy-1,4-benzoquinol methylase